MRNDDCTMTQTREKRKKGRRKEHGIFHYNPPVIYAMRWCIWSEVCSPVIQKTRRLSVVKRMIALSDVRVVVLLPLFLLSTTTYSYSFFAKYPLFTTVDCMIPYTDSPRPRYDSAADLAVGFVVSWSTSRLWRVCWEKENGDESDLRKE